MVVVGGGGVVVGGSGTGSGVTQPLEPSYDGGGQAGAVTVVSLVGASVGGTPTMMGTVVGVVDVEVVGVAAGFSLVFAGLAGRGRSMPT